MTEENPNPERHWRHRRWMAWAGLGFSAACVATGFTLGILHPESATTVIIPVASMGFWGGLLPMGAYVGNCAASEIAKIKGAK